MKFRTLLLSGLFALVSNAEGAMNSSQSNQEVRDLIETDAGLLNVTYQDFSAATRVMYLEDAKNMDTIAWVLRNRLDFDQKHDTSKFCGYSLKRVVKCPGEFGVYKSNKSIFSDNSLSLFFNTNHLIPRNSLMRAYNILKGVLEGKIPDRTKGATYFGTDEITNGTHLFNLDGEPCYAKKTTTINGHRFLKPNC